jgi:DNA-binding transcriptional MocR family regulator
MVPLSVLGWTDLGVTARHVYAALLSFAWRAAECFPSETELAGRAGIDGRTVRRAVAELREAGWVVVVATPGKANRYRLVGPRATPETVPRRRTPDRKSGVHGACQDNIAAPQDKSAGVGGQGREGTPDFLSSEVDPRSKSNGSHPLTRGEIVPNSSSARATAAERVRAKMDAQAAWRAARGER